MIFFAGVFLIPMAVAAFAFFMSREITWRELLLQSGVQLLIAVVSAAVVYHANTHDDEVWTGVVTTKQRERVSCSHSYPCNCRQVCTSDSKGNQSCSTVCDTCYEHSYDYNWVVYFSTGDEVDIDRVDRQGVREPPRFSAVKLGEPAAIEHGYTNYIKAAPDTLFRRQGLVDKYASSLPAYPGRVYDYYKIDRFVSVNMNVTNRSEWNHALMELNADVGNKRQADVAVVLARNVPREWFFALEEKWLGGKKNDVVVVVSVNDAGVINWVETMAWVTDPIFKVRLRDDLMSPGANVLDPKFTLPIVRKHVMESYHRKPMADYEYLKSNIRPSTTEWLLALIFGIAVAAGISYIMHREDVFGEEGGYFGRRKRRRAW